MNCFSAGCRWCCGKWASSSTAPSWLPRYHIYTCTCVCSQCFHLTIGSPATASQVLVAEWSQGLCSSEHIDRIPSLYNVSPDSANVWQHQLIPAARGRRWTAGSTFRQAAKRRSRSAPAPSRPSRRCARRSLPGWRRRRRPRPRLNSLPPPPPRPTLPPPPPSQWPPQQKRMAALEPAMARRQEPKLRRQRTARQRRQGQARRHTATPAALRRWRWTGCCGVAARRSGKRRRRTTAPSPSTTERELQTLLHTATIKFPAGFNQYWKARRSVVWAGAAVPLLKDRVSTQPLYAVCFTHINLAILSASLGLAKSGGRRHPFSVVRSRESKPRLQRQVLTTGACVCTGHHEISASAHSEACKGRREKTFVLWSARHVP